MKRFRASRAERLPAIMHPKPVRRVLAHGAFKRPIDVLRDGFNGARAPVQRGWDFLAGLDVPPGEPDAITKARVKRAMVAQGQQGRSRAGGTTPAKERRRHAPLAGVLIRK